MTLFVLVVLSQVLSLLIASSIIGIFGAIFFRKRKTKVKMLEKENKHLRKKLKN